MRNPSFAKTWPRGARNRRITRPKETREPEAKRGHKGGGGTGGDRGARHREASQAQNQGPIRAQFLGPIQRWLIDNIKLLAGWACLLGPGSSLGRHQLRARCEECCRIPVGYFMTPANAGRKTRGRAGTSEASPAQPVLPLSPMKPAQNPANLSPHLTPLGKE